MTMPSRMSGAFGIDRRRTARKTGRVLLLVALALSLLVPGVAPVLATTRPLTTLAAPRAQRADAGYYFGAEIRSDGTLWTWGYNEYGQLGDGTFVTKTSPVQIGLDRDWATVSAGDSHVLAIKTDGTLWAWGWNDYYTLGLGETDAHYSPTQVGTDTDWVSVAAGEMHSLGLKSDGTLWAWGDNAEGQLGQGDNLDEMVPAQVGSDADWAGIAAGAYSSAAIKVDGTLWMWGANGNGQLGLGDTAPRTSPDMVTGDDWTSVSLGYSPLGRATVRRHTLDVGLQRLRPARAGRHRRSLQSSPGDAAGQPVAKRQHRCVLHTGGSRGRVPVGGRFQLAGAAGSWGYRQP